MKKIKLLLALVILVAAGVGTGGLRYARSADHGGGNDEAAPGGTMPAMPAMPVQTIVMAETAAQIWNEFPGRLEAVDMVELRPQVSGTIKEIKFEDGQMVNAGDVLFVIDTRAYEAEIAQIRADLQASKNQYELARKELKRAQELITTGAIPKRTYDERLNAELVSKSAVASAEARLKRAQLNLDYAHVKAPISGRVSRAEITAGNLVEAGPNAPVLTTIVSSDGIYAGFDVDEQTYLRYYARKSEKEEEDKSAPVIPVKLALQSAPDAAYEGKIHSFDNKIDTASGTIRARAYFKNDDGMLLPGMFVSVRLGSPENKTALLVPERAVGTDQDRKFVYVVGPDNTVAYREVSLGESIDGSRVVISGLKAGDQVITDGIMKIQPGMPVAPQAAGQQQSPSSPSGIGDIPGTPPGAVEPATQLIPDETEEKTTP